MGLQFVPFCDLPLDRVGGPGGSEPSALHRLQLGCSRISRHTTDGWGAGQLVYASVLPDASMHISIPLTPEALGFGMFRKECKWENFEILHKSLELASSPEQQGFVAYTVSVLDVDWSPGPLAALVTVALTNNLARPLELSLNRVQCRWLRNVQHALVMYPSGTPSLVGSPALRVCSPCNARCCLRVPRCSRPGR